MTRLGEPFVLYRAMAKLVRWGPSDVEATVLIPAMDDVARVVPHEVVPAGTPIGGRFRLRCTLDPDYFDVAPALSGARYEET